MNIYKITFFLTLMACVGCRTSNEKIPDIRPCVRVMSKAELHQHIRRQECHYAKNSGAAYIGSDAEYDYFIMTLPPLKPLISPLAVAPPESSRFTTVFCRMLRKDTVLKKRKPIDCNRSTWRLIKDLNIIVAKPTKNSSENNLFLF